MIEPGFFAVEQCGCADRNGHIEFAADVHTEKAGRGHADDFKRVGAERKGAADGARGSAIMLLPEAVTQYRRAGASALVVRGCIKRPAAGRSSRVLKKSPLTHIPFT